MDDMDVSWLFVTTTALLGFVAPLVIGSWMLS